jgi:selenocysteine lyase/cysteine desulfurase
LFAGLAAPTDYFVWLGEQVGCSGSRESKIKAAYSAATAYEMPIAQRLIDGLAKIAGVQLQGISAARLLSLRVPTVSITHTRQRTSVLAKALAAQGINVWSGHNYALEVVRHLGLDEQDGVLRIGLAHYNTVDEIDRIIESLKALLA